MKQDEHLRRLLEELNTDLGADTDSSDSSQSDPPKRSSAGTMVPWLLIAGLLVGGYFIVVRDDRPDDGSVAASVNPPGAPAPPRPLPTPVADGLTAAPANPSEGLPSPRPLPTPEPIFDAPRVPVSHGLLSEPEHPSRATLTIKTSGGSNYYVKLVSNSSGQTILTAFITGGRDLQTNVPAGQFELRYAVGQHWHGTNHLFGPGDRTRYWKADDVFEFQETRTPTIDGVQVSYSVVTVELILQVLGNLETRPIQAGDF